MFPKKLEISKTYNNNIKDKEWKIAFGYNINDEPMERVP